MAPGLRTEGTRPSKRDVPLDESEGSVARSIRGALDDYLARRKLVKVKIRQVEGKTVDGFLKIEGRRGERLLVDFGATTTQEGTLSSLDVGGRKISLAPGPAEKRGQ